MSVDGDCTCQLRKLKLFFGIHSFSAIFMPEKSCKLIFVIRCYTTLQNKLAQPSKGDPMQFSFRSAKIYIYSLFPIIPFIHFIQIALPTLVELDGLVEVAPPGVTGVGIVTGELKDKLFTSAVAFKTNE